MNRRRLCLFYRCTACDVLLKPLPGDCCVFCSYGISHARQNVKKRPTRRLVNAQSPSISSALRANDTFQVGRPDCAKFGK